MNKSTLTSPESQKHYFDEDTISLLDLILALARESKVVIITPTILCTLTIIYVMFFAKPVYGGEE